MRHAGDEDRQLDQERLRGERARIVDPVAVLALERTKPPIGSQLSVYSVSPFDAQDLRARRKADAELEDPDAGQRAVRKCPSSWMSTSAAEDEEEQDDRDERLDEAITRRAPSRGREGRANLGVERDEVVEVRRRGRRLSAEPRHRRLEQARDAR